MLEICCTDNACNKYRNLTLSHVNIQTDIHAHIHVYMLLVSLSILWVAIQVNSFFFHPCVYTHWFLSFSRHSDPISLFFSNRTQLQFSAKHVSTRLVEKVLVIFHIYFSLVPCAVACVGERVCECVCVSLCTVFCNETNNRLCSERTLPLCGVLYIALAYFRIQYLLIF